MMHSTSSTPKRVRGTLLAVVFWAAVWQLASMTVDLPLLLPGPVLVAKALWNLARDMKSWGLVLATLLRVLGGFLLGALAGFILAVLTEFVPFCGDVLAPAIRVIRATPVASFILLCMLWMHSGFVPAFIAALMVLPVVWGNLSEGFRQTDRNLLEMAQVYGMGRIRTFLLIYLPTALPNMHTACGTGLVMAWKSGVAAEVLCQPKRAVGTQLYFTKIYLETENLFAWTAVVIVLSVLVERLYLRLTRKLPLVHETGTIP